MQEAGFRVIYSDTDSIFLTLNEQQKKEDALAVMEQLNRELPGLMELEFQGHYPAGIFVSTKDAVSGAKKRYALIDPYDRLTIKGFESIRRNTALIAKEAQQKVLTIILKEQNPTKAFTYIQDLIAKVQHAEIPVEKFVIRTRLSRELDHYEAIGPHVYIARRMREAGKSVGRGSVISYVIRKGSGIIRERAALVDTVSQNDIDSEYYINNQLLPAVEKIFEVLGYAVHDLGEKKEKTKEQKDQQTLQKFFS